MPGDDAGCASRARELSSRFAANDVLGAGRVPDRLGPWIVGKPLGSGAMGAVFSARHAKSGQQAAIKIAVAGTDYGRLLHLEAVALAGCEHRGVVQIHDHGEDQGFVWLALQLVDGETLREWIARRFGPDDAAPLSKAEVRTVVGWMRDLARALHAMHRRGVLHRDVKPANLMLSRDGEARVIDLGLAVDLDGEPIAALAGTAPYMSPEQVLAAALVDARSDVYSLAASLYETLSGWAVARGRGSLASVLQDVAFVEAPRLSARVPNALPGLDAVFAKALAKAPAQRYRDAATLAEDLDRVLDGQLPKWAQEPAVVRWRRRVPMVSAVAVVALVLAWFGAGWWADRVAMAEFRDQCVAAREATTDTAKGPGLAIKTLQSALQLQQRFAGVQEFEDLYHAALAELAPGLTRWMFQKAALATTADVGRTTTGIVGKQAEAHLASQRTFAQSTAIELSVQAAFGQVRAMHTKDAKAVLEPLLAAGCKDERVVALHAMATLWDAWDSERGELKDRAAYERVIAEVGRVGFEYANLESMELCVRAMLLLEVSEIAEQVPASASGSGATAAALKAALVAIEEPLEKELTKAAQSRDAGNYVACLLALVRLRIDKPAAAREVLELRLGAEDSRPDGEERTVMRMFSAAAGFRALVKEVAPACAVRDLASIDGLPGALALGLGALGAAMVDATTAARVPVIVERLLDAADTDPRVTTRFVMEVGRRDSEPEGVLYRAFETAVAGFFDGLWRLDPRPEVATPAMLALSWHALAQWYEQGRYCEIHRLASHACRATEVTRPSARFEAVGARVFWCLSIRACKSHPWPLFKAGPEHAAVEYAETAVRMFGRPCFEAEVARATSFPGPSERVRDLGELRDQIDKARQDAAEGLSDRVPDEIYTMLLDDLNVAVHSNR